MPIYEYKCEGCGSHYEQIRRMAEADNGLECPECHSAAVNRQLSSFATTSGQSTPSMEGGMCGRSACSGGTCGFSNN